MLLTASFKNNIQMAKPIKETPILKGADAIKFIRNNQSVAKESKENIDRIEANYELLAKISKF